MKEIYPLGLVPYDMIINALAYQVSCCLMKELFISCLYEGFLEHSDERNLSAGFGALWHDHERASLSSELLILLSLFFLFYSSCSFLLSFFLLLKEIYTLGLVPYDMIMNALAYQVRCLVVLEEVSYLEVVSRVLEALSKSTSSTSPPTSWWRKSIRWDLFLMTWSWTL